jgi:hypothetical protein
MKYCLNATRAHPLSKSYTQYIENINTIIVEEGGILQPFNNEIAINFDKIKKNADNEDVKRMKSMDMVVAIRHSSRSNPYSLLVDFKLNCGGTRSIKDGDCKDKIKHSKVLLFGSGIPVYSKSVFIFKDDLIQESRSLISRILNNPSADVLTLNEFKTLYF